MRALQPLPGPVPSRIPSSSWPSPTLVTSAQGPAFRKLVLTRDPRWLSHPPPSSLIHCPSLRLANAGDRPSQFASLEPGAAGQGTASSRCSVSVCRVKTHRWDPPTRREGAGEAREGARERTSREVGTPWALAGEGAPRAAVVAPTGSGPGGWAEGAAAGSGQLEAARGPCEGHVLWLQREKHVPGLGREVRKATAPLLSSPHIRRIQTARTPALQGRTPRELSPVGAGGPAPAGAEGGRRGLPDCVENTAGEPVSLCPARPPSESSTQIVARSGGNGLSPPWRLAAGVRPLWRRAGWPPAVRQAPWPRSTCPCSGSSAQPSPCVCGQLSLL